MDSQRRWISYDTFKLIVGLLLLLLMLFFMFQTPAVSPASAGQETQVGAVVPTQTLLSATNTAAPPPATATAEPSSIPTTIPPTTAPPPTATQPPQPSPTATTVPPTATATQAAPVEPTTATQPEPTATPANAAQPEPTATPQAAATATPQASAGAADCPLAQPSRLAVGNQARIITNLNLRQEAGMDKPIIQVGLPNTNVEIIGGPVCTPYQNGAYLWWNIRTPDGKTGWSAEASLSNNFYFLQPVP